MLEINYKAKLTCLPSDNPYLQGAWEPVDTEYTATNGALQVIGEVPRDLNGVYLRNGHNQIHAPIGRFHPFDGDGMIHGMRFRDGKVTYRNRWVRTIGFLAEQAAGKSLWPGIIEPKRAERRGWGSIGAMKDNAGTDIVVHNGRAYVAMSQCSEPYIMDPLTLETIGIDSEIAKVVKERGICSHFKVDELTGHMMFFNYGEKPPYMNYGVMDASGKVVHYQPIDLPGARWPHDLGMTENYSVLHDLPMFFEPEALKRGSHRLKFHHNVPARFGIIPRFGTNRDVLWFEGEPCYILHLANTYEDGDEIVMDGCIQRNPIPEIAHLPHEGYERMKRLLDLHAQETVMHQWRFNLKTGQTRERDLDDQVTEFPMVHGKRSGRQYRYSYNALSVSGFWLLNGLKRFDMKTGKMQEWHAPAGVTVSEAPFAARDNAKDEDDGYLVTFCNNLETRKSECAIFDARDITKGPIGRVILPHNIPTGAHAFWAPESMLKH